MARIDVQIPTTDGRSKGSLHLPEKPGRWPAVLVFPDAGGLRETFAQLGDRLAELGYVTLIPDTYYRAGDWAPFDVATLFTDNAALARMGKIASELTPERVISDAAAYADFLLARPEVRGTEIGTVGYCLGGWMSLTAAGGLGERVAAAASFHGGRIAVADDVTSPHLAADRIRASVYVAGAQDDRSFTAEQAELLAAALSGAGVAHTIEFYPAHHGFAIPDNPTYDQSAADRHWAALDHLYGSTLTSDPRSS